MLNNHRKLLNTKEAKCLRYNKQPINVRMRHRRQNIRIPTGIIRCITKPDHHNTPPRSNRTPINMVIFLFIKIAFLDRQQHPNHHNYNIIKYSPSPLSAAPPPSSSSSSIPSHQSSLSSPSREARPLRRALTHLYFVEGLDMTGISRLRNTVMRRTLTCTSLKVLDVTGIRRWNSTIKDANTHLYFAEGVGHHGNQQVEQQDH